jgi:benzylsuccinate CoA-transferase BbsE subunit
MPEQAAAPTRTDNAPLRDITVLEVADEFSAYAGRLLADLGAEVTRVTFSGATVARQWWPMNAGKREQELDLASSQGRRELTRAIEAADIVINSGGADAQAIAELDPASIRRQYPHVIQAILTPFGLDGPKRDCRSTDLTRLAAGGLLWLGGYPDAEPVAPYGDQSTLCTAIFAVIAVLLATIDRDRTGVGHTIEVSAQEVLTQALETSLPEYELTGKVRRRVGSLPREAGTGVYPCADGYVSMVAGRLGTARAWRRLREWLVETAVPGAAELLEEDWETLEYRQRPESIARFATVFCAFTQSRLKQELYLEAQRRNIALAPVNTPLEVLMDPQLVARHFFHSLTDEATGATAIVPSPPYRFTTVAERVTS